MALNGVNTIQMDSRNQVRSIVEWEATQNKNNNASTITVRLYAYFQYAIYSTAAHDRVVNIHGQSSTVNSAIGNHPNGVKRLLATVTKTVQHNDNGDLRARIRVTSPFRVTYAGQYINQANHDFNIDLDKIPRQSTIDSVSDTSLPFDVPTFFITAHVSTYRHTARLSVDGVTIATLTNLESGFHYFTLTQTQEDNILNRMKNVVEKEFEITLETFSGTTKIGTTTSDKGTFSILADVVPIIRSVTQSEANAELADHNIGAYMNGLSRVRVEVNAEGDYGATIREIKTTILDQNYTGSDITTPVIVTDNTVLTINVVVTDTRGRTATESLTFPVVNYTKPMAVVETRGFYRVRADYSGGYLTYVVDEKNGDMVSTDITLVIANLGTYNLPWSYKIEILRSDSTTWEELEWGQGAEYTLHELELKGSKALYEHAPISGDYYIDPLYSYSFRITVWDQIETSTFMYAIQSGFVLMDFHQSGEGVAIGKSSELLEFEVALPARFYGAATIHTLTDKTADNMLQQFRRLDHSLIAALAFNQGNNGDELNLHLYDDTETLKTTFTFKEDGTIIAGGRQVLTGNDSGWIPISFNSGWGAHASSYTDPEYRKIGNQVYIKGLIKRTSGTDNTVFTLPVGFRPKKSGVFTSKQEGGGPDIYITNFGRVSTTNAYVNNTWMSMDTIMFFID